MPYAYSPMDGEVRQQWRTSVTRRILAFLRNESGATAIEYAMLSVLIGIGLLTSLMLIRDQLSSMLTGASNALQTANGG